MSALQEGTADDVARRADPQEGWRFLGGVAAIIAGAMHLASAPHHLSEALPLGLAFIVVGLVQVVLGAAFGQVHGSRLLALVVLANVGMICLYVLSRTVDLFFLPPHGQGHEIDHLPTVNGIGDGIPVFPGSRIESVGVVDVVCVGAEFVLVAAALALIPPQLRSRLSSAALAVAACVLAVGAVSLLR